MSVRVKNAAATRETMLASARTRFLKESYENVGLRDIAGDAGVDVALIGRYFGSKERLFNEVLRGGSEPWLDPEVTAAGLPGWLATLATRAHDPDERKDIERLLIILRSASSPTPAAVVQQSFRENVLEPVARLLDGPDAEVRASLALSLLIGTTVLRTIMRMEPLHECDTAAVQTRLTALFAAALA